MKVYHYEENYQIKRPAIVLGSFESLHMGHYELFKHVLNNPEYQSVIMFFSDPCQLPKNTKLPYTTLDIRLQQAADLGFEYAIIIDYQKVKNEDGNTFIKELVKHNMDTLVVCGSDFKYGVRGNYQSKDLAKLFKNHVIVNLETIAQTKIATSLIKEQIPMGFVELANQMTIYDWAIKIKLELDSSFKWPKVIQLHSGIYASTIEIDGYQYYCALHYSLNGICKLEFIDAKIKILNIWGREYILNILNEIRIVSNQRLDKIQEQDIIKTKQFFINLANKEQNGISKN